MVNFMPHLVWMVVPVIWSKTYVDAAVKVFFRCDYNLFIFNFFNFLFYIGVYIVD